MNFRVSALNFPNTDTFKILKDAGFGLITVDDVSKRLKMTLQTEIDKFEKNKDDFVSVC